MAVKDPLPRPPPMSATTSSKKRKATKPQARVARHTSPSVPAAVKSASSTLETDYYPAPLTESNLALAGALESLPNRDRAPMLPRMRKSGAADDASCASDITTSTAPNQKSNDHPSSWALAPRPSTTERSSAPSGHPRIIIRIPSLAARRALAQARSNPPPHAPAPPAPHKRSRSREPTPDSEEDDFAASFMRKRHVSAAMFCTS